MITGEQLSAYLAGELDADEREAVEAALDRDPDLRARLQRLRASDEALSSLPPVAPPDGFSERLHTALDRELEADRRDELRARRAIRSGAFGPLAVATAAAAVIALFGVAGVWLLRGGGADDQGAATAEGPAMEALNAPTVPVEETDNDYDEQRLQRLAVGVDFSALVPRDLPATAATPLADRFQRQLLMRPGEHALSGDGAAEAPEPADPEVAEDQAGGETGAGSAGGNGDTQSFSTARQGAGLADADRDVVAECLPTVLEDAPNALIPVYVELARFDGEPAVIYTLVSEDPESGTYRRVEVWALARADCQVLSFAQHDRS